MSYSSYYTGNSSWGEGVTPFKKSSVFDLFENEYLGHLFLDFPQIIFKAGGVQAHTLHAPLFMHLVPFLSFSKHWYQHTECMAPVTS